MIDVAGTLRADASSGAAGFVPAAGYLDATGGAVTITADGGTIDALNLVASAEAFGAFGDFARRESATAARSVSRSPMAGR